MAEPGKRFVVSRLNWSSHWDDKWSRQPGGVSVASFATLEEAEAERAKREQDMRKKVNPFDFGKAVHYWTHLDEPRLRDWLMDHDIDPPKPNKDGTTDWAAWWKKTGKKLAADKLASVWEILDKVRFFAVREEPVRPVGYAVLAINWEYNDENYSADAEGGRVMTVYRSRERAEEECQRLNEEGREEWSFVEEMMGEYEDEMEGEDDEFMMAAFDMRDRLVNKRLLAGEPPKLKTNEGLFKTAEGVPFYEVIEVELEGLQ